MTIITAYSKSRKAEVTFTLDEWDLIERTGNAGNFKNVRRTESKPAPASKPEKEIPAPKPPAE